VTAGTAATPPGNAPDIADNTEGPSDNTTLTSVIASYESAGFTGQFSATDEGLLHCFSCDATLEPSDAAFDSLRRMEGASDPADMLAVLALTCPRCSTQGTAVLHFGPEAGPGESAVLLALEDHRADSDLPGGSAPTEAETRG